VLRGDNPEVDVGDSRDDDDTSVHFGGFEGERIVVSASFYPSRSPVHPGRTTYQLRYMATDVDVQGRGYGAKVLVVAQEELARQGVEQLWANGRDTALGFYFALGWSAIEGSEHVSSETGLPHTVIVKQLGPLALL